MENDKQYYMQRAIDLSMRGSAEGKGYPFGAVVVRDGQVVGEGYNQVYHNLDPTAHAEVVAIRQACTTLGTYELAGCELYTSCEPCPMCLGAIYWAKIEKIYYANTRQDAAAIGFDDAFIYDEVPLPLSERAIPMTQMSRQEALEAFKRWEVR
ncbi:tRNA(Arg) A34 adenosine deaminase TadA [Rhabdobacter roseus]|uniref:tRNA(Arg) A34 adenosine deaminase TadA n=1 Tax=Rhabdobacter roseus TaxID=1655419 RepID=A0A840TWS6_9BACT|nr:nucleoside deaminase [Rhabdobacter roseus]MBB5286052.1 tRNA(Arg) A34 adenosine deaminase TadA [Rhabdobacter roseus]